MRDSCFRVANWVAILAVFVFASAGVTSAGQGAAQDHPGVNVLEGAATQLHNIELRLSRILSSDLNMDSRDLNGTTGALRAISLNLRSIDRRVEWALDALPDGVEVLPQSVDDAVAGVNEGAVLVADRARLGFAIPPDDIGVYLALEDVRSLAEGISAGIRHYVTAFWDRVIPVRFVQVHNCYPWAEGCDPHVEWDALLASVQGLNEAFAPADLHFMIKAVDRYFMYHFAHESYPVGSTFEWFVAVSEIGQVFPVIDLLDPPPDRNARGWLDYMSTVFSDPTEMLVWIFGYDSLVSREDAHRSGSTFPNGGRTVIISAQNIFDPLRPLASNPQPALSPYHLVHEVGHFFGVRHSYEGPTGTNPYTGDPVTWPDLWDLIYCVGDLGLPLYFSSREGAASADCEFHTIEQENPINCHIDNRFGIDDSDMECLVQDNVFASGHPLMKGLSFDLGTPENPPDSFAWGLNAMGYWGRYNAHLWTPGRFSASQVSLIWGHAHASVSIPDPSGFFLPFVNLSSQRDLLGTGEGD